MNKNILIGIAVAVIAAGAGFFGGMQYQKGQQPAGQFIGQGGQFRQRFGANGQNFRPLRGQILSMDNNTMTVKLNDGSSKIVVISDTTIYSKSDKAVKSDLTTGDTVMVLGIQNSDGSVTAEDVQINPQQMRMSPTGAVQQ